MGGREEKEEGKRKEEYKEPVLSSLHFYPLC
jgi:hypothetical protein